jgi:hypothetical protein
MRSATDVETELRAAKGEDRRILTFAALLRQEAGLGVDDLVVVGGSAIEIYTEGAYVSGDLDICAPRDPIQLVLNRWGFTKPGREWARLDWKIVVDVVGPRPSGSMRLTRVVETVHGPVRLGAVEDLILGRLALIKFWREPGEWANAELLVRLPRLDWDYLDDRAGRDDVVDELALLRRRSARLKRE